MLLELLYPYLGVLGSQDQILCGKKRIRDEATINVEGKRMQWKGHTRRLPKVGDDNRN